MATKGRPTLFETVIDCVLQARQCRESWLRRSHVFADVPEDEGAYPLANDGYDPDEPRIPAGQPGGGQWTAGGGRTKNQLEQARQKLDEGYAKEVNDIKNMQGISDQERTAGLKSLEEKYQKARHDLDQRISRIEQTAQDIAFAYGGNASDYYKDLNDSDPKVRALMETLDHLDNFSFKDDALVALRHVQGGTPPPPFDPHVLNAMLLAGIGAPGEGGMKGQAGRKLEEMGLRDVELAGSSFNTGRKQLEDAGFKWVKTTPTGRRIFQNSKTGAEVLYDSDKALVGNQKPHWHILDSARKAYDRSGRLVKPSEQAAHIPAN